MINTFRPCLKILPGKQQRLLPELVPAGVLGFVLYGGTAIGLRIGHRKSVDFDFFSERKLDRETIQNSFSFVSRSTVLQDSADTLSLLVGDDDEAVKVSFFGGVSFGRVGEPEIAEGLDLPVASLEDLMATKVKEILQRVEAKDYRDIAAMIEAEVSHIEWPRGS